MSKKTVIIIVSALLILGIGVVIVIANQHPTSKKPPVNLTPEKTLPTPTTTEVAKVISQQAGDQLYLDPNNFTVTNLVAPASRWFVASVHPLNGADDAKAIIRQNDDGSLSLVIGPGTAFLTSELKNSGVPGSVQRMVVTYEG